MSEEINERCYICKYWDSDNQISIRRFDKNIEGYLCSDSAAECLYKEPPTINHSFYHTKVHTLSEHHCSGFCLQSQYLKEVVAAKPSEDIGKGTIALVKDDGDRACAVCHKKFDKLVLFGDGDAEDEGDELEICESCIEKGLKKIKGD